MYDVQAHPVHRRLIVAVSAALAVLAVLAVAPRAAQAAPAYHVTQERYPTNFAPGGTGTIYIDLENAGTSATSGQTTIVNELPAGLTATSVAANGGVYAGWDCTGTTTITCVNDASQFPTIEPGPYGDGNTAPLPGLRIDVSVDPGAAGTLVNRVRVSGGGAAQETSAANITIDAGAAAFGPLQDSFRFRAVDEAGHPVTQAGAHPFGVTTSFAVNSKLDPVDGTVVASEGAKDIDVDLPTGLVGDPQATPQCGADQIAVNPPRCPVASQVGTIRLRLLVAFGYMYVGTVPVYNLTTANGETAAFGFNLVTPIHIAARIRQDSDYGVSAKITGVSQAYTLLSADMTLWGVPADPAHDAARFDPDDPVVTEQGGQAWGIASAAPRRPFLTMPSDCSAGPLEAGLTMTSYEHPDVERKATSEAPAVSGCDAVDFRPAVSAEPTSSTPGAPTGLDVKVDFGQSDGPGALAVTPMKDIAVQLPEGMTINPASADGLQACTDAQVAFGSLQAAACPPASKIGTATGGVARARHAADGQRLRRRPALERSRVR